MNILIITATYPPSANGVAVSTKRTVSELRKRGHRVIVYGPKAPGVSEDSDYVAASTIRIGLFGLRDYPIAIPHTVNAIVDKLPTINWDIIHVHHPIVAGQLAVKLGKKLRVPVVFTYHTRYDQYIEHFVGLPQFMKRSFHKWIYENMLLSILRSFDGVIATTTWLKDLLKKSIPGTPIYYASTAGLTKPFLTRRSKQLLRNELGFPPDEPVFLSVSRLSKEKRTDILLRGFLHWADRHQKGTLVIIGDGANRKHLEAMTRKSPHHGRVKFMGKIPNEKLHDWYSSADVFLYSSITDTIGINILEAMSAGLPVVAPDHMTTREIIVSGNSGVLYKGDALNMGRAIDTAFARRNSMAKHAVATSKKYHVSITVGELTKIYETVIGKHKKHT